MGKVNKLELSIKEKSFLNSITNLHYMVKEHGSKEVKKYQPSCDPCEACGPDACYSDNSGFLN